MSSAKIKTWQELPSLLESWRKQGRKIVFTNGCFDILHAGHVCYLEEARELGDRLIVGLNSDSSVSRLKGDSRPVIPQQERALVLAALECVDCVVIFEQDTPSELIELICPDVLVKGGDWAVKDIVGSDFVLSRGGEVHSLAFKEGLSSSAILARLATGNPGKEVKK